MSYPTTVQVKFISEQVWNQISVFLKDILWGHILRTVFSSNFNKQHISRILITTFPSQCTPINLAPSSRNVPCVLGKAALPLIRPTFPASLSLLNSTGRAGHQSTVSQGSLMLDINYDTHCWPSWMEAGITPTGTLWNHHLVIYMTHVQGKHADTLQSHQTYSIHPATLLTLRMVVVPFVFYRYFFLQGAVAKYSGLLLNLWKQFEKTKNNPDAIFWVNSAWAFDRKPVLQTGGMFERHRSLQDHLLIMKNLTKSVCCSVIWIIMDDAGL